MKIAIVVGTRPEIIKMSPVIRECVQRKLDFYILHTGQHYSYHMDQVFFEQLGLPAARYNLEVGSGSHGVQTAKILSGVEQVLLKDAVDVVLVQGDTNTVLAGVLAASKLGVGVGHVEAGLRSYDRGMPEEINRVVADHVADFCFAPTPMAKNILLNEGISEDKIVVTGNTIVDAVYQHVEVATHKSNIVESLGLSSDKFFLVTVHRQENVDDQKRFSSILSGLSLVHDTYGLPVVFPVHPRAKKMIEEFHFISDDVILIDPVDFVDFLQLERHARLVLTDSGGVQEESCIVGKPCVTLRDNTERPETVEVGANMLAGTNPENICESVGLMLNNSNVWENPFGDGTSGQQIVDFLESRLR